MQGKPPPQATSNFVEGIPRTMDAGANATQQRVTLTSALNFADNARLVQWRCVGVCIYFEWKKFVENKKKKRIKA